jgi:hypothetical protein
MNEQMLEALYEAALAGSDEATEKLITALIYPTDAVREAAAWSLSELIDGDALSAEQVKRVAKYLPDASLDTQTHDWLADAVRRFEARQPQPCPDCGRYDCRRMQLDADDWYCEPDPMNRADEERY